MCLHANRTLQKEHEAHIPCSRTRGFRPNQAARNQSGAFNQSTTGFKKNTVLQGNRQTFGMTWGSNVVIHVLDHQPDHPKTTKEADSHRVAGLSDRCSRCCAVVASFWGFYQHASVLQMPPIETPKAGKKAQHAKQWSLQSANQLDSTFPR